MKGLAEPNLKFLKLTIGLNVGREIVPFMDFLLISLENIKF